MPHMCSQADDPSQHVSDDTLRAALVRDIVNLNESALDTGELADGLIALGWSRAARAASATDDPNADCPHCLPGKGCRRAASATDEGRRGLQRLADFDKGYDAGLAASATDEPTRLDVALDSYGAGWSDAARLAASATDEPT